MSDLLREFWYRAECEEPVFSAEEIEWAPPGQFDRLCSLGLLKETDRATWARCEACGDGHVETVVWVQNATTGRPAPFVPCPENGGTAVWIERLRRWAIDLDAIGQAARRALSLVGNDSVLLPGRVWFLGRRHVSGRFRDFFFVVGAARDDAHTLWDRCRQVEDAPSRVLLVPSRPPSERKAPTFRLADIASITDDRIIVDLDYLGDALPRDGNATPAKTVSSFPVPPDATWAELRLVVREHTIVARIRNQEQEFGFDDLGISGPDDRLWRLLCLLASRGGQTPGLPNVASERQAATFRKQISDLRQRLQTVFPIAGDPVCADRRRGGYRSSFQVNLDRRDGFPIQAERWEDCTFTELRDGRIAISVGTAEFFTATDFSRRNGPESEAAERAAIRTEAYDLRGLGLADQSARPTVEGQLLLDFLRNHGKMLLPGDDKCILRLAKLLRDFMGLASEPFQFSQSRTLWRAVFESATFRDHAGLLAPTRVNSPPIRNG
jgi:hypothetical protein